MMYLNSLTCWGPGLPPASGCTYTCFKHCKSTSPLSNPLLMLHFCSNILKPRELVQSSLDCLECVHKKVTSWRTPYLLSYVYWGFIVLNQVHDGEKHYSGKSFRVLVCQAKQRRTEVSSPSALSFPFSRPSEVKAKQ